MKRAYKFRIYPNKNQEVKLNRTLDICRHLYNDALAKRKHQAELNRLCFAFQVFPWGKPEWIDYYVTSKRTYLYKPHCHYIVVVVYMKYVIVISVLLLFVVQTAQAGDVKVFVANHSTEKVFKQMISENNCLDKASPFSDAGSPCMDFPFNRAGEGNTSIFYNEDKTGYATDSYHHGDQIRFYGTAITDNKKIEGGYGEELSKYYEKCGYESPSTDSCNRKWNHIQKDYVEDKYKFAVKYNMPFFIALYPQT